MDCALGSYDLGEFRELISAEKVRSAVRRQHGAIAARAYEVMQPAFLQVRIVVAGLHHTSIIAWDQPLCYPIGNTYIRRTGQTV